MKIVIRAGGTGTRLWPLSRIEHPKQFLPLYDNQRSCVQQAYHRFTTARLAPPHDVYVSIGKNHYSLAREQLPDLPDSNFIVEPAKMDTAAAIALETVVVAGDDPDVVIASLGSDHYIGRPNEFVEALQAAEQFLTQTPETMLAIACEPVRIETGYGHIKMGAKLGEYSGRPFFAVDQFTEKPDYPTAKEYTESGNYLWNANFFAWTSGTLMEQFREFRPAMYEAFFELQKFRGTPDFDAKIKEIYPTVEKVAVDYAILEPGAAKDRLAVLPVSMDWSDIGSWASITDAFPPDAKGNLFKAAVEPIDVQNCTIFSDNPARKLITAIGIDNLAVIDTEDALLIVPKDRAGEVKEMVGRLKDIDEYADMT